MNTISTRLGGLDCRVVDNLPPGQVPRLLVVLSHGYGASGEDLVPIGTEILSQFPALAAQVRFVFPAAPLSLPGPFYDARAWWHLDVERLGAEMAAGRMESLRKEVPEGLTKARRLLRGLLDELTRTSGLPMSQVVVGGFSQGAMLSTDVVLRLEEAPAALCIFSGALMSEDEWLKRAPARAGLPVLQSHGRFDWVLPFQAGEWVKELLEKAGLQVEFLPFNDGHTIPPEVGQRLGTMLNSLLVQH